MVRVAEGRFLRTSATVILSTFAALLLAALAEAKPAPPFEPEHAMARLGDCVSPQPGPCHYMSAYAALSECDGTRTCRGFLQLEFTTIVIQGDRQVYLRDVLCNVFDAKFHLNAKDRTIVFADTVSVNECEFLVGGEAPHEFDVFLAWTATIADGCSLTALLDGESPGEVIFCVVRSPS